MVSIIDNSVKKLKDPNSLLFPALLLLSPIFLIACYLKVADNDLFARVAVGRLFLRDLRVPQSDVFAYTPTKPLWIDHEWLSGVAFYITSQLGGDLFLFSLSVLTAFITIFFILKAQKTIAPSQVGYSLIFLSLFPASFIWSSIIRSQVFTFAAFAILLFILTQIRKTTRSSELFYIPPLIVLWANFHGGFVVGLGFISLMSGVLLFQRHAKARWLLAITAISTLSVLINPYGLSYIPFILEAVTKPRPAIHEWSATRFSPDNIILFVLSLVAFLTFLTQRLRSRVLTEGWLFLLVTFCFALKHQRHTPFFLFTACVYLPPALDSAYDHSSKFIKERIDAFLDVIHHLSFVTLIASLSLVLYSGVAIRSFSLDYSQYPTELLQWLKSKRLTGNLMIHFDYGSFALLKGYPNFKVSMDGRYEEVYPDTTFNHALSALDPTSPSFTESFQALKPDFVILCPRTTSLSVAHHFPGNWSHLSTDSNGCTLFGDGSITGGAAVMIGDPDPRPILAPTKYSMWDLDF